MTNEAVSCKRFESTSYRLFIRATNY